MALDTARQGGSVHKNQASWAKASPMPVFEKTKKTRLLNTESNLAGAREEKGVRMGEISEGNEEVQTSSYKINKSGT